MGRGAGNAERWIGFGCDVNVQEILDTLRPQYPRASNPVGSSATVPAALSFAFEREEAVGQLAAVALGIPAEIVELELRKQVERECCVEMANISNAGIREVAGRT